MTIFVSIAAYRDPELIPTIEDCLRRARWPGDLRFGVCWQHAEGEPRPRPLGGQLRLLDVPWHESQGACWARAEVMKLYDGEDWFLQLDSHHRFEQDWDRLLLEQAEQTLAPRPLLTTYGTPFDPAAALPPGVPTSIAMPAFRQDGIPVFQCRLRPEWGSDAAPVRARFLSAHLLFAQGSFVADVPYDPELYFYGEEITLAARAFTHGYDLFHPGVHILWHQEPRRVTPLHWNDHVVETGVAVTAQQRDAASLAKVRQFLSCPPIGPFGCGTSRSFQNYESYVGANFLRRYVGPSARQGDEPFPPVPAGSADLKTWNIRIVLDRNAVPPPALDRPSFWYVGFHDGEEELARADAPAPEISRMLSSNPAEIVLERQIRTARPPRSWTVWPTDRQGRWLGKLSGPVDPGCLA